MREEDKMWLTAILVTLLAPFFVGYILRRDRIEYNVWWENILYLVFSPGIAFVAIIEAYVGEVDIDSTSGASFVLITAFIASVAYWVAVLLILHALGLNLTPAPRLAF